MIVWWGTAVVDVVGFPNLVQTVGGFHGFIECGVASRSDLLNDFLVETSEIFVQFFFFGRGRMNTQEGVVKFAVISTNSPCVLMERVETVAGLNGVCFIRELGLDGSAEIWESDGVSVGGIILTFQMPPHTCVSSKMTSGKHYLFVGGNREVVDMLTASEQPVSKGLSGGGS